MEINGNERKMEVNEKKMNGNYWQKTGVNSTNKWMADFGSPMKGNERKMNGNERKVNGN